MKKILFAAAVMAALLLSIGCEKTEQPGNENLPQAGKPQGFTLTVDYGDPASKAQFLEGGLDLAWTHEDVLYLVTAEGGRTNIIFTNNLTEPASTATFHTAEIIDPGQYFVLYGNGELPTWRDVGMRNLDEIVYSVRLYGALEVTQGQTSAHLTLKHMYAMLNFNFTNLPGDVDFRELGMAVSKEGLPDLGVGTFTPDGLVPDFSGGWKATFGWNNNANGRSLIVPVDLTGKKVHFYAWGYGPDVDGKYNHVTYEFIKNGLNLEAGVNYNLNFDFTKADNVTSLVKNADGDYPLSTAAELRAAAFWNNATISISLEDDVDFDGEDFFPINACELHGNGHAIYSAVADFAECTDVGIIGGNEDVEGNVDNLNVVSSTFVGKDDVGAVTCHGAVADCVVATSTISGSGNYVGGLAGKCTSAARCSLKGNSSVKGTGKQYVGGIAGYCAQGVADCFVSVGCYVSGSGEYTGGIAGYSYTGASRCGFEASVDGGDHVGGILGKGSCDRCYAKGYISGKEHVGGLTGQYGSTNSYFIGSVTCEGGSYCGGISGSDSAVEIRNCYSFVDNVDYGMAYSINEENAGTLLTNCAKLSAGCAPASQCGIGKDETFVSRLSDINGNQAFISVCWKSISAGCPILSWQYDGFSLSGTDIPSFSDQDW